MGILTTRIFGGHRCFKLSQKHAETSLANILSHFLLKNIKCFISCLSNDLIVTDVLKDQSR